MRTVWILAAVAAVILGGTLDEAAAKPKSFVLAKINGQKLRVTGKGKLTDKCLKGAYSATNGIFGIEGIECRNGRAIRNGRVQIVIFLCSIPPLGQAGPCAIATYSEVTLKRFSVRSEKDWGAAIDVSGTQLTSTIMVTLDSFDGTILRGRFSGVYQDDLLGTGNPPAPVNGEGTFAVPMTVE